MKVKVSSQGVFIPRTMLGECEKVEVQKRDGIIIVVPEDGADPAVEFGKSPVTCGEPDASTRHDHHLYGGES